MKYLLSVVLFASANLMVFAQHEHHDMATMAMPMDSVPVMSHSFSKNLPMNRNGSGTAWLPDATPLYAYMKHSKSWNFMFHGSIFLRYNWQNFNNNYQRGGKQADAPNWLMGMAQRSVGNKGLLTLRLMMSLDRLTVGGNGYPLLFQSGETFGGKRLIDRQHPHDLFSEVGVGYTHSFNENADVYAFVGYPGEPALGPTAFMHRISAFNNPDAPLGHHWQDATHILFGVATTGFRYKIFKIEGSVFTGREPDENRYDFDRARFDSYSYRISANPNQHFSLQFSQAFIKSPENLEADENVVRTTASVIHAKQISENSHWNSALVWGMNKKSDGDIEHSLLAESNLQLSRIAVYGRYEFIQKSPQELDLQGFDQKAFGINALTLGLNYNLYRAWNTNLTVGVQGSLFLPDRALENLYGKNPLSGQLYVRLSPALLKLTSSAHRH
ncbi:MAG: hypothetical protein H7Y04_12440 [Verrucomicrobia bacterium]|nr:hypothetical protein [Cytophagales bacterium]